MDINQAALGGVFDTDQQHDPAIQGASAVTGLPQAPSPSAEPPWLLKDLTETIASFLCPVDALALDASGSATRCVLTISRRPLLINSTLKKPSHCCAKRCVWRAASSEKVMISRF